MNTPLLMQGLNWTSKIRLDTHHSDRVRLKVDEPLHIRSIRIDGVESAKWSTAIDSASAVTGEPPATSITTQREADGTVYLDIPMPAGKDSTHAITVESMAPQVYPVRNSLPSITVDRGFILEGRGLLRSKGGIAIEDFAGNTERLSTTESLTAPGSVTWQWQWSGDMPNMTVAASQPDAPWSMKSVTRLSIQNNAIAAVSRIRLSNTQNNANHLTLPLGNDWFIDSVALEQAVSGFAFDIQSEAGKPSMLALRWDAGPTVPELRLLVSAHQPAKPESGSIELPAPQLTFNRNGRQEDVFVLESIGRFHLLITPELMRVRVREEDLLPWQREELPRMADAWLFRVIDSTLPPLQMQRTRSTHSAKLTTEVIELTDQLHVSYTIQCRPISGGVDQVQILLPIPDDVAAPIWTFQQSEGASSEPSAVTAESSAVSTSSGETDFRVTLSRPVARPFELKAELTLPLRERRAVVPLPNSPQAVTQDSILIHPPQLQIASDASSLEILPSAGCCGSGPDRTNSSTEDAVALRYDANAISHLEMVCVTNSAPAAWVSRAVHDHLLFGDGHQDHRSNWTVSVANPTDCAISLPSGWNVVSVEVDGKRLPGNDETSMSPLTVPLPAGTRVTLSLECHSQAKSSFLRPSVIENPQIALPVSDESTTAWIPHHMTAWPLLSNRLSTPQWHDRFFGSLWDNALLLSKVPDKAPGISIRGMEDLSPKASESLKKSPAWQSIEITRPLTPASIAAETEASTATSLMTVRLFPRTACTCAAASWLMVIIGSVLWIAGRSLLRWWILFGIATLATALVPLDYLFAAQSLWLGTLLAMLLRTADLCMRHAKPPRKRGESTIGSTVHRTRSTKALALLVGVLGLIPRDAIAQPPLSLQSGTAANPLPSTAAGGTSSGTASGLGSSTPLPGRPLSESPTSSTTKPEIFAILIPIDDKNQVASNLVYVPTRLSRLLSNPTGASKNAPATMLISAAYSFRISTEPSNQANSISEIAADLKFDVLQPDSEVTLPFGSDNVQIIRVHQDGQDVSFSPRLKQSNSQLSWRAGDSGVHTLRVLFRPLKLESKDNRQSMTVDIPMLSTSKLEILGDDLRDVQVDALGNVQWDTSKFMSASIGALNQLSVSWPKSINRATDISQVQVFSDTWLHFHPDSVVAVCQLRITGAGALPETLRLIGDPAWHPIGNDWQGARLLRVDSSSVGSRPTYTVTRPNDGSDRLTIRTLMLPRDEKGAQSLAIPFLSLQESSPLAKTLAVSNVGRPRWKRVGTENWQPILSSQIGDFWGTDRLAEQPTLLRVPGGQFTANLQRLADPLPADGEEITEASLQAGKTRMRYSVHWSQPLVGVPSVRFRIPSALKTESVLVDGLEPKWTRLSRSKGRPSEMDSTSPNKNEKRPDAEGSDDKTADDDMIVFIDAARGGAQSIDIQAEMANDASLVRLPRILLETGTVSSSLYQVLRGAEVLCEVSGAGVPGAAIVQGSSDNASGNEPLQFEPIDLRPSVQLLKLQTPIGQLNLGSRYRESTRLPIEVRLQPRKFSGKALSVMRLQRSDQGWMAQLDLELEHATGESSDFIFLDVPSSLTAGLRDSSEKNHPLMNWPSADSSRSILCIMPSTSNGPKTRISLTMRLSVSGASQSITIPDINILAESGSRPLVALPNEINQPPVRWTQGGRALPSDYLQRQGIDDVDLSNYSLFDLGPTKTQAVWQPRRQEERVARILLTQLRVQSRQGRMEPEEITYWIDPRNQIYLDLAIPNDMELRGAELNGRATTWSKSDDGRFRFLMQPSYLPIAITLKCHRRTDSLIDAAAPDSFSLPQVSAQPLGDMLVEFVGPVGSLNSLLVECTTSSRAQELDLQSMQAARAAAWAEMLRLALPTAADRSPEELRAWLPFWEPQSLRLPTTTPVPNDPRSSSTVDNLSSSDEKELTAAEFWTNFSSRFGGASVLEQSPLSTNGGTTKIDPGTRRFLQFAPGGLIGDGGAPTAASIRITRQAANQSFSWLWMAIPIGIILLVARLLRTGSVADKVMFALAENLWPAWLALLLLTAAVSPAAWPVVIVGLGASFVFLRLLVGARRESRGNRYPYRVR
ncbi:MAG: hypothetical protein U0892_01750 [Pirellulales bacterium]